MANTILTPQQRSQREANLEQSIELEKREPSEFNAPPPIPVEQELGRKLARSRSSIFDLESHNWLRVYGGKIAEAVDRYVEKQVERKEPGSGMPIEETKSFVTNQPERRAAALDAEVFVRSLPVETQGVAENTTRQAILENYNSNRQEGPRGVDFGYWAGRVAEKVSPKIGGFLSGAKEAAIGIFDVVTGRKGKPENRTPEQIEKDAQNKRKKNVIFATIERAQEAFTNMILGRREQRQKNQERLGIAGLDLDTKADLLNVSKSYSDTETNYGDYQAAREFLNRQAKKEKMDLQAKGKEVQNNALSERLDTAPELQGQSITGLAG